MNVSLKQSLELWRNVFSLLKFSGARRAVTVAVLTILEAGLAIGSLYLIKLLVDVIADELGKNNASPNQILFYVVLTGAALLAAAVIQSIANYSRMAQAAVVSEIIDHKMHQTATTIDLAFYESPQYFDSLERARQAGSQRPAQVVGTVLLLIKSAILLVGILVMISGIDWRLLPAMGLAVAAFLVVQVYFTRTMFDWRRRRVQMERRASYLDWLMTSNYHAKELRLSRLSDYMSSAYTDIRKRIRTEQLRIEWRRAFAQSVAAAIGALVFAGATAVLVLESFTGSLSIGDLVLFVLLFRRAEVSGRELVMHISKLYDDQLFLTQLFDFLKVKPEIVAPASPAAIPEPIKKGLRVENVSFRYPSSAAPTLRDIDMVLEPGKVIALVGENGSGKTSLIKLLCRLYDPESGKITLDGADIRAHDPEEFRALFSVVFQDYARYSETARENIHLGDVRQDAHGPGIEQSARLANAHEFISELPKGFDTPLTRMFDDGQELSIGQWQRLALARALYPPSKFIIMDEPTSALDPKVEYELFENFRERIGDRCALVISHRLSTVRMADYTYVLDKGRIVENGTHDELVSMKGTYADLFQKQGRNYRI